ncbi:MAG: protein kinase [Planctomycetia bacterium]|nr:protein kinase [Planctomycetia bacterium]
MIAFTCSHCGLKLKVKPEFAGRSSRCPTCKQPLVVPPPSQTLAEVGAGVIEGTSSSLVQAGVDGGVSLEQAGTAARQGSKSVREILAGQTKKGGRYIIQNEIARGGMGAVLRAIDCDIRREVAVKYLLDQSDPKKKSRFVEEAQITGQLEHPNIVPIHELGVDSQQRLFFAMKMVKGQSLAQVLDSLRANPKSAESTFSLGRLLNIFVSVCNALAYSHSCGVVHRDLKPANIMIGDFGEVYVMDWGLAKVCSGRGQEAGPPAAVAVPSGQRNAVPFVVPVSSVQSISSSRSIKVETSREPDADLTQEGSVLGTPVYMPPEQAVGRVQTIDQRSDVYSLGAILYEILTLQPPIGKEGGYMAILMRVAEGDIVSPEQRNPQRAKAGKIPRELSAIALKALAKNPQDRYPHVESLRRDIERFQEGRSVSAKDDTKWEMAIKFVKRNKGFSAATAIVAVLLVWSSWINYQARREAERANKQTQERTEKAVPALVEIARLAVERRRFANALEQVDLALAYTPDHAEARLLKGQLLILDKKFPEARVELEMYLRQRPADGEARRLGELCSRSRPDEDGNLLAFAQVFEQQKTPILADGLLTKHASNSLEARKKLLELYRQKIDAKWPGLGQQLSMDAAGIYALSLYSQKRVTHLDCLEGMPITTLNLGDCKEVQDLTPLKGMPLRSLDLLNCGQVRDLTPLKGMPLTTLHLNGCGGIRDVTSLKGMPLTILSLSGCPVQDLTPLKGLPLTTLNLALCGQVQDLSPLKGVPLTTLGLRGCELVQDLTPLQGMPLTSLDLTYCRGVQDLTPLKDLPLTSLNTPKNHMKGLEFIRQMKSLKTLNGLKSEEFWKKYEAGEFNK